MTTITPQILLKAYCAGIFPMAESADDNALYWVEPDNRGVLPLSSFHVSRSLKKQVRRQTFKVTANKAFGEVMDGCARAVPGRPTTWINERIRTLYGQLFKMGFCHSIECWHDGQLAGGLYGVHIGAVFFGESMFSRHRDASKVALVHLVARLKAGGFLLLDSQFITDHLKNFGAVELAKADYHKQLGPALDSKADFTGFDGDDDPETVLSLAAL